MMDPSSNKQARPGEGWSKPTAVKPIFQMAPNQTFAVPHSIHQISCESLCDYFHNTLHVESGVILLEGGEQESFYDTDGEPIFRQSSWFQYLFGVKEPSFYGAITLTNHKRTLFIPRLPDEYQLWCGKIQTPEYFQTLYNVDEVLYTDEMKSWLILTLKGGEKEKEGDGNDVYTQSPSLLFLLEGINTDSGAMAKPAHLPDSLVTVTVNDINRHHLGLTTSAITTAVDNENHVSTNNFSVNNDTTAIMVNKTLLHIALSSIRVLKSPVELQLMKYCNYVASKAHVEVMRAVAAKFNSKSSSLPSLITTTATTTTTTTTNNTAITSTANTTLSTTTKMTTTSTASDLFISEDETKEDVIMMEYELEAKFQYEIYSHGGCRHVAYTSICACGPNNSILHYGHAAAPNNRLLCRNDMALLDMGAIYHGYCSDITCSFPVSGHFTDLQRAVYECVLAAQEAVYRMMHPGAFWVQCHEAAEREILKGLLKMGVLTHPSYRVDNDDHKYHTTTSSSSSSSSNDNGNHNDNVQKGGKDQTECMNNESTSITNKDTNIAISTTSTISTMTTKIIDDFMTVELGAVFFPHGLGHLIGCDTHDVGGYIPDITPPRPTRAGLKKLRTARVLQAGMVLTVEPGCYLIDYLLNQALHQPNQAQYINPDMLAQLRMASVYGVRLEDDVVVTDVGIDNYTTCPRLVEEIESVMSGGQWPPVVDHAPYLHRKWCQLSSDGSSMIDIQIPSTAITMESITMKTTTISD